MAVDIRGSSCWSSIPSEQRPERRSRTTKQITSPKLRLTTVRGRRLYRVRRTPSVARSLPGKREPASASSGPGGLREAEGSVRSARLKRDGSVVATMLVTTVDPISGAPDAEPWGRCVCGAKVIIANAGATPPPRARGRSARRGCPLMNPLRLAQDRFVQARVSYGQPHAVVAPVSAAFRARRPRSGAVADALPG